MPATSRRNIVLIDGDSLTLDRAEAIGNGAEIVLANSIKKKWMTAVSW